MGRDPDPDELDAVDVLETEAAGGTLVVAVVVDETLGFTGVCLASCVVVVVVAVAVVGPKVAVDMFVLPERRRSAIGKRKSIFTCCTHFSSILRTLKR